MADNRAPRVRSRDWTALRAHSLNGGLTGGISLSACAVALALGGGLLMSPSAARAGTCVRQGTSGSFVCSGPASDTDTMESASDAGGNSPLVVTTTPGFGLHAAATSLGNGLGISGGIIFSGTTFTDNNAAVIIGDNNGIAIGNERGALSVVSTGTAIGGRDAGILATNGNTGRLGTRLFLSANNTMGPIAGIRALNLGTGDTDVRSTGTAMGGGDGIFVGNDDFATSLTLTANDANGDVRGIRFVNLGTGDGLINSTGKAAATLPTVGLFGIEAANEGPRLTINANNTSGPVAGISATHSGIGAFAINSTGRADGTGPTGIGITAANFGTDLTIMAKDSSGGMHGISARNNGTGALSITTSGVTTGTAAFGITAVNNGADLTVSANTTTGGVTGIQVFNGGPGRVSVTSSGAVTGGNFGIFIQNDGAGPTSLSVAGMVTGGMGGGIGTQSGVGSAVAVTLASTATVGTSSGSSGAAIRDGAGNAIVTINRSTVNGAILLGAGNDTLTIASGTLLAGVTRLSGGDDALPDQTPIDGGALRTASDTLFAEGAANRQGASVGGFTDTLNLNAGFAGDLDDFEVIALDTSAGGFTLGGMISNADSLTKNGMGTLTLSGISSFTGPTMVTGGTLNVTGMIAGSPVMLQSGTTLTGTGTVGAVIAQSGSTVSPGSGASGIGTLSINGNLTLGAGSTLAVDISPTGQDRVNVTGAASLGGALVITPTAAMGFNQTLDFLTATTVTGSFTSTTVGGAFGSAFAPRVVINGSRVSLQLAPNALVMLGGGGLRGNALSLATAFDAAVTGGVNPQPFMGLFTQGANLPTALDQFTGELHSVERLVALEDTRVVRDAVFDRLRGGLSAPAGGRSAMREDGERTTTLWTQGIASNTRAQADGIGSRFTSDRTGFLFGGDMAINGFTFGGMFSYVHRDVDLARRDSSKVRSVGGAVYVGYRQPGSGFAAGAGGAVANAQFKGRRSITVPGVVQSLKSRSGGTTYQVFAEASYDLAKGESAQMEPFVRVAYAKLDAGRLTEAGGVAAVRAGKQDNDLTTTTIGMRGAYAIGRTTLSGSAGYQHASGDRSTQTDLSIVGVTNPYRVRSVALDRNAAALEAQASFRLTPRVTLGIGYSGVIGSNNTDHGGRGTLTFAL